MKNIEVRWSAPSNIALVKYWGKLAGVQIPANPSVSLTLSKAVSNARLTLKEKGEAWIELKFEGRDMPSFLPKIEKFFNNLIPYLPWIENYSFVLETSNSFPHSAGIASSASSMAAMALCLTEVDEILNGTKHEDFYNKASLYARLGSGSACRSLFSYAASWGLVEEQKSYINEYATAVEVHDIYQNMYDSIFVVSAKEKSVSSRAGHALMEGNPYANARFGQARENWKLALKYLANGDWDTLGEVVEEEALSLHAMMMASRPGYLLMEPDTISMIHRLREFRKTSGCSIYFTLDAGPNLHILYPEKDREQCWSFISECQREFSAQVIDDQVGVGPVRGGDE